MLKTYNKKYYYQINGNNEWFRVGDIGQCLMDRDNLPNEELIWDNWNWQMIMDFLKKNTNQYFYRNQTTFRKIPYFYCYDDDYYTSYRFFFGDFETFSYKVTFEECNNITLADIIKCYPADLCVQYLKERGIALCPLNN